MEMELYNTTDKTKVLPKFNYEGKMTMKPHDKVEIQDYMAPFYKPYAKIGIVVRPIVRMGEFSLNGKNNVDDVIEPEVAEIISEKIESLESVEAEVPVEEVVAEEEKAEEKVETIPEATVPGEVVEELEKELAEESEVKKYTKSELSTMSIKSLRDVVKKLGLDIKSNKKSEIIKGILKSQD